MRHVTGTQPGVFILTNPQCGCGVENLDLPVSTPRCADRQTMLNVSGPDFRPIRRAYRTIRQNRQGRRFAISYIQRRDARRRRHCNAALQKEAEEKFDRERLSEGDSRAKTSPAR